MGLNCRILLLILTVLGLSQANAAESDNTALLVGDKPGDLRLPAARGYGFSLREQLGKPVLLIWVGDCNIVCRDAVPKYEALAKRYSKDYPSLTVRVVRDADGDSYPRDTLSGMSELINDSHLPGAWKVSPVPAVMLISPEGVLDRILVGNLNRNLEFTDRALASWLSSTGLERQR
ncbi:hypothetical protein [Parathalassolituus penaei]|uniref:Thioredoxin domain-containing protein n=1 Tax=Parathalassolituus penaei TaxID=2997323 RepID=A0A9X3ITX8_9GAMM|nr:hypothetical protein [Parathalassolituus penaei]MCY0965618.1 hypothetical protein [Parathalassolituus penaei]